MDIREGRMVYIVDDDASVRKGLERLMRANRLGARSFSSPEPFLEEATAQPFSCVLLDITMPQMSGLQVQARMKEKGIEIPVIVVSARDDDDARQSARNMGAQFFLHKPVDDQALLDAIVWVTEGKHGNEITNADRNREAAPFGGTRI
jgi:FixJ family two-component response regulator